jgi:hypothetical protein
MLYISVQDFRNGKTREEKRKYHEIKIFQRIFSEELEKLDLGLRDVHFVKTFCLAEEKHRFSYQKFEAIGHIDIETSYDFRNFLALQTNEERFSEFKKIIFQYVVPALNEFSDLSKEEIHEMINLSLEKIALRNYEVVFLAGKTPKKSPNRKQVALLRGIHQSEGFQLYCEVFDSKGFRIANKLLVEEVGDEDVYARFLGELKWENDSFIRVKSRTSSWEATVEI